ncbi:hypothetical protein [Streptomyces sp. NPDC001833]|uniref:hypothetical protein n=1 Tax=Streptomyces sp. NPDC001833 TaxID=3154658 RepID=UPI00332FF8FD
MPSNRALTHTRDAIRNRLLDIDSITMTRRGVTDIYREAHTRCLAEDWLAESNLPRDSRGDVTFDEMLVHVTRTRRVRMSIGIAMKLRLTLEEIGIHCDPWLERLDSASASVRFYRKWQVPEQSA